MRGEVMNKRLCLLIVHVWAAAICSVCLAANATNVTKGGIHVTNPPRGGGGGTGNITDVHIYFSGAWTDPNGGTTAPPVTGGTGTWNGSPSDPPGGPAGSVLNYDGGTLTPGNTIDIGRLNINRPAGTTALVTKVEFTTTDAQGASHVVDTLSPTIDDKRFHKYVSGFTNFEFFDFSTLSDVRFVMPGFPQLRYILNDFALYTNVADPLNFASSPPVFSTSQLVIEPGQTATIDAGQMSSGWAFASIGTLTIEDTTAGDSVVAPTRQFYGESLPIPEPQTYALMLAGMAAVALVVRTKGRA
jgi:hypothetical protein